ncbi:MAG: choice-of-anchor D domain-containing protein [Myxococcaceae bacterium]|nr:choice-of-anchor D domain-containing protein [Myxococcaceae bacterium]
MLTSQHSPHRLTLAPLIIAAVALALGACDCGRMKGPTATHPDLVANPVALSFEACPTVDEEGNPVADVFPDQQKFTLDNLGNATATLSFQISGPGADQFQIAEETKIESLEASGTAEIAVNFSPKASGDVSAQLTIDDGDPDTEPVVVALVGSGRNLPAQPSIRISYEVPGADEMADCIANFDGKIDNCLVSWPDTFIDQTSTLRMKIRNEGCPTLKITDLSLEPMAGAPAVQFFMEQPAIPPTQEAPILLSTAAGTAEQELRIRFEPKEDGTGDGQRYAQLTVRSNAAKSPESLVTLFGYTVTPAIYATPPYCNFTDANDTCGGTKIPTNGSNKKAVFRIQNGGTASVVIDSVTFRAPASGRFEVGALNPQGKTINPGESEDLEILYTDNPVYVTDIVDVVASSGGQPAGKASIRLSGGVLPCLTTNPAQTLDYSGTTDDPAVLPLEICNGTSPGECGALVISNILVTQGAPLFSLKSSLPQGTEIASGTCQTIQVQFDKPIIGGLQQGTLEISSNDPDYAPPSNYKINLQSQAPLNQIPVAVLEGPGGETNAFSRDLSATVPPELLIHGEHSYDPPDFSPGSPGGIAKYQFLLAKKPPAATADLVDPSNKTGPSVDGVKGTLDQVLLKLDPTIAGEYKVVLVVYDETGLQSQQTELKILMNP